MPKRKSKTKARADGEGTIYQRTVTRRDGSTFERWEGKLTLGYDQEGKRLRRTVYGKSQGETLEKLEELKRQYALGTLTFVSLTVAEFMERWLSEKARTVKPRTEEIYRDWSARLVYPSIGKVKLEKLTPLIVQGLVNRIADSTGIPTANKVRRMLYGALKQAVRWQLVPRNVVEATDPLKETPKEIILWSPAEAVRFLDHARADRCYALFYLVMATGLRRGELLGLQWGDLKRNRLHIQRTYVRNKKGLVLSTPKTSKGKRFVTLPEDMLEVLAEHKKRQVAERAAMGEKWEKNLFIFTAETGGPLSPQSLQTIWTRLQALAEVPHARLHDLRHLHVSLLIKQGFDPRTVADRVGHTDPAFTLRRYSHMFEEQREEAAVNLKELLGSNTPPEDQN